MTQTIDGPSTAELETLVGTWRRFGDTGPVYQILAIDGFKPGSGRVARVRVAETGEEFDYRLPDLLADHKEI